MSEQELVAFGDSSYAENVEKLERFAKEFSDIVRLHTARERYGIEFTEQDKAKCSSSHTCEHHIVIITDHSTWTQDMSRPHVFLSGALHGDERVTYRYTRVMHAYSMVYVYVPMQHVCVCACVHGYKV